MDPATFSAAIAAVQSAGGGFFAGFGATAAAGSSAAAATAAFSGMVGAFCGVSAVVLAPVVRQPVLSHHGSWWKASCYRTSGGTGGESQARRRAACLQSARRWQKETQSGNPGKAHSGLLRRCG